MVFHTSMVAMIAMVMVVQVVIVVVLTVVMLMVIVSTMITCNVAHGVSHLRGDTGGESETLICWN